MIRCEKNCIAGQAANGNTAHAHCMLDNEVNKYTLRMCDNYCFSIAIFVADRSSFLGSTCMTCLVRFL